MFFELISPALPRPRATAWTGTLRDCLLEARPVVQIIFFVRLLAGLALAGPHLAAIAPATLLAGTVSWGCAMIFVYLYNGAADIVEDRASGHDRPIARGDLPRRTALAWCRGFASAALVSGLYVGPAFALPVLTVLGLGYLYSAPGFGFKRHYLGAALVAALGGSLTFLAGFLLGGGELPDPGITLLATAMPAWMGGVGSVAKDFSDVRGDALAGRRTLVVIFGRRVAGVVVSVCALCVGISFTVVAWMWVPAMRLSAASLLVGAFCVTCFALRRSPASHPRNPYRAFMVSQYAATLSVLHG
ncbi:UbiA family prenyltransferase [Amycolatopsis sp. NPDC021455]|uniref:UbiA prenyltransferase family protein n=1 Tax=Amycolatopsis sp. NPDC021455 TaxID=3154901 RepID=UPI0033C326C3